MKVIKDEKEQLKVLISGMKMIAISSPMDYEELAKNYLEMIGIDTSNPKNMRP